MIMTPHDNAASRAGDDLDPAIRRFVREMSSAWARYPELAEASPAEARRIAEIVRAPWAMGGPKMASVTEHRVPVADGEVSVRCYDPGPAGIKPGLIYLHGGGWTLFSLDTHDRVMREYAGRAGMMIVGVDYALAPEAKYPVALDEVCAVAHFIADRGAELGVDSDRIAIGGDSAGANLAVAASLRLRDAGWPRLIRAMLLNYGVFEHRSSPGAQRRYGGEGYMLSSEEMDTFWGNYLRDAHDVDDPLVCPVNAELHALPPALLVVPECDLLAEQSHRMAELLRSALVLVELRLYQGASHSFLEAISIAALADRAFADSAAWLRTTLACASP